MIRVRHLSVVDQEIEEAIAYYLEAETPQSAERLDTMIQKGEELIAMQPMLYPICEDDLHYKLLSPFPYSIIYSIEETEIVIVALANQNREYGYWRDRF